MNGRRRAVLRGAVAVLCLEAVTAGGIAVAPEPVAAQAGSQAGPAEAPTGRLVVELRAGDGTPIAGARVALRKVEAPEAAEEGIYGARAEGPPGRYVADGLAPGRWEVQASAAGRLPLRARVRVASGATARLALTLRRRPLRLPELVAAARRGETPPAGRSVDRIAFRERSVPAPTLAEWLAGLPGVALRGLTGGGQTVSVRGSRPEGVLVLLDGLPLNDPISGVADLTGLPTSTLESATLLRGASPGYGSGALAGVLLLRSRQGAGSGVTAVAEAGSFGRRTAEAHASAEGSAGVLATSVVWEEGENDFRYRNRARPDAPWETRRNADFRSAVATLAARSAALPLSARLRLEDLTRGAPGRMGTTLFDRARRAEDGLQLALALGEPAGSELEIGYRRRRLRYFDPRSDTDERQAASEARIRGRLALPWAAVAEWRAERSRVEGDAIGGAPVRWTGGVALSRAVEGDGVVVTPALHLELGTGGPALDPSLAVQASAGGGWTLRARLARARRWPTFGDLYFASEHGLRPNPSLRPERVALEAEMGAAWRSADGALEARLSAFHRRTRDPIVWLPSAAAVWSPRNLERLTAEGVEADASWRPAPGWRLRAGATGERSRVGFGSNRNPLPYAPSLRATAAVERSWPDGGARIEGRLTGARTTGLSATHRLPAFLLLDAGVRQRMEAGALPLAVELRVRNLAGARYELVSLFPEPGRSLALRVEIGPWPPGRGGRQPGR